MNPWPGKLMSVTLAVASLFGPRSVLSGVYWVAGLVLWVLPLSERFALHNKVWIGVAVVAAIFILVKLAALFLGGAWIKPIFPVDLPTQKVPRLLYLVPDVAVCIVGLVCSQCQRPRFSATQANAPRWFFLVAYCACGASSLSACGMVYSIAGFFALAMPTTIPFQVAAALHTSVAYALGYWTVPNKMAMLLFGVHDTAGYIQVFSAFALMGISGAKPHSARRLSIDQNEGLLHGIPAEQAEDILDDDSEQRAQARFPQCRGIIAWFVGLPRRLYNPDFGVMVVCFAITLLWPCVLTAPFLLALIFFPVMRLRTSLLWYLVVLLSIWYGYNVYAQAIGHPMSQVPRTYTVLESIGLIYFRTAQSVLMEISAMYTKETKRHYTNTSAVIRTGFLTADTITARGNLKMAHTVGTATTASRALAQMEHAPPVKHVHTSSHDLCGAVTTSVIYGRVISMRTTAVLSNFNHDVVTAEDIYFPLK